MWGIYDGCDRKHGVQCEDRLTQQPGESVRPDGEEGFQLPVRQSKDDAVLYVSGHLV